ncbi:MAG: hypothetical protein WCG25_02045 [bacterium]
MELSIIKHSHLRLYFSKASNTLFIAYLITFHSLSAGITTVINLDVINKIKF